MRKFSVVTVCLNTECSIMETIQSVLAQKYTDFEYIIKDGISQDKTLQIAESFVPEFAEKGITYRIISQADSNVYDAMNQAAHEAQGEWILYMNSGDQFADSYVLEDVEKSGKLEEADIVYGDCIDSNMDVYRYRKAYALDYMQERLPFCHQSVFVNKRLYKARDYSLNYRLCSDYHFFYCCYQEKKRFSYLPMVISIYDRNGISSDGSKVAIELLKIHEDMGDRNEEVLGKFRDELIRYERKRPLYREILLKLLPDAWIEKRRKRLQRENGWIPQTEFFCMKEKFGGRVNHKAMEEWMTR